MLSTGAVLMIAQTGKQRSASFAGCSPTLIEAGYKDMVFDSWFGLFAPAETPPEIIRAANIATAKSLEDPTLRANFANPSLEVAGGSPEQPTLSRAPIRINMPDW